MMEFRHKCAIESVARLSANVARWLEDTEKRKGKDSTAQHSERWRMKWMHASGGVGFPAIRVPLKSPRRLC
jgi:hypothetical protein